jgi:thiol-disulfide isomerase/thioredoxin
VVRGRVECLALIVLVHRMRPAVARKSLITLAFFVLFASFMACSNRESTDAKPTPVLSGPPSTTFPMPPLKPDAELGWIVSDNKRAKLADYRGKILVLDFYATWCLPCRESIPRLIALQRNYGPEGVQVVGLNVGGADDRIKVAEFSRELHIQYPLGFPDQSLTDLFLSDDQTIPQTFVFGREGQLVRRLIGYQESTGAELEKVIKAEVERRSEKS